MAAYHDWTPGEIATAANLDIYTTNLTAICITSRAAVQGIPDSTTTAINFDTDNLDPNNWHSTGVDPSRVKPTVAGWYHFVLETNWSSDTDVTALRQFVGVNGSTGTQFGEYRMAFSGATTLDPSITTSGTVQLNGTTDYVEAYVSQANTSTGSNSITVRFKLWLAYPT